MKLQQKLMALAILGIAAAAPAHAAIDASTTNNGELFMTVFDSVGQQGYTLDLNLTMDSFLSGISLANASYTFAADAVMTSFLNGVAAANKPNLTWAVQAMDSISVNALGGDIQRYITTSTNIQNAAPNTNLTISTYNDTPDTFVASHNALVGVANSRISTSADGSAYVGATVLGNNFGGKSNFTTTGLIGSANNLWLVSQTSPQFTLRNNAGSYAGILQVGNQAFGTLDTSGNLTFGAVAAIPEADTWAMFAAGLLVVGAIARRRMAA